jgi:hypothetical protein
VLLNKTLLVQLKNDAGAGHEDDDDDDNSSNLQHLFGNPAVNGERGRKN